jgi:serine/threonine protein kinase
MKTDNTYKVIGEGSYGCVVKPSMSCKNNKDKEIITKKKLKNADTVSKIYDEKDNYKKELKLSKKAAMIDNSGNNLLLPTHGCSIKNTDLEVLNGECDFDFENENTYYQLVMPYGGKEIKDYLLKHKTSCKQFLKLSKTLFEGLVLLKNKKYCHQDIKVNNVLITPQHKMIIIDYSLMKPFTDIYNSKNDRRLSKDYFLHPPEYKLVYYFNESVDVFIEEAFKNIKAVIRKLDNRYDFLNYYFTEDEILSKLTKMYYKYHKLARDENEIRDLMTKYANKMDIYSTGVIFISSRQLLIKNCSSDNYSNFIKRLIEFDPEFRMDANEAFQEVKKLYNKLK